MSLWTKPLSEVTFEDVEDFCKLKLPEGSELDYKRDIPNDLATLASAFANTWGGLIILGVAGSETNQPVMPIVGLEKSAGLSERITQICRDGISPSVMPEISPFLELPTATDRGVMVVRVEQSPMAPHAIRNKTRVYVRTGDVNHPTELCQIDRLAEMLNNRKQLETDRENLISRSLDRFAAIRNEHLIQKPFLWISISPLYPRGEIASVAAVKQAASGERRRVLAGGALYSRSIGGKDGTPIHHRMWSYGRAGDIFYCDAFTAGHYGNETEDYFHINWLAIDLRKTLRDSCSFYARDDVSMSGPLLLSIGFQNVRGICSVFGRDKQAGLRQLDDSLRIDTAISYHDLATADLGDSNLLRFEQELMSEVCAAFDLPELGANHYKLQ